MLKINELKNLVEQTVTTADYSYEEVVGEPLTEAAFTEMVVSVVRRVLGALKDAARRAHEACVKFGTAVKKKVHDFFINAKVRRSNDRAKENDGPKFGRNVVDTVREKAKYNDDDYFLLHKWDNIYIESLADKAEMVDNIRIRINNADTVLTANDLLDIIQEAIDKDQFDLDVGKQYNDTIVAKAANILQLNGSEVTASAIVHRAAGSTTLRTTMTTRIVDDMIQTIKDTPNMIDNVAVQYRSMTNAYADAERKIGYLRLTTHADSAKANRFTNLVSSIVNMKAGLINIIHDTNVSLVNKRCDEYMRELIDYTNA